MDISVPGVTLPCRHLWLLPTKVKNPKDSEVSVPGVTLTPIRPDNDHTAIGQAQCCSPRFIEPIGSSQMSIQEGLKLEPNRTCPRQASNFAS